MNLNTVFNIIRNAYYDKLFTDEMLIKSVNNNKGIINTPIFFIIKLEPFLLIKNICAGLPLII